MPRGKARSARPATVLFIASNPTQTRYAFAEELARIQDAGRRGGAFTVTARWSVGVERIATLLDTVAPDVVHLLSPAVDPQRGLILSDERGRPQYAKAAQFARAFAGRRARKPKLVVLNTCDSAAYAKRLAAHVGCAVGMDGMIYDHVAVAFSDRLYRALAAGETVSAALERARAAIEQLVPEQRDVPTLYAGPEGSPEDIAIAARVRGARGSSRPLNEAVSPAGNGKVHCVQLFCSYSHKDAKYRAELEVFLAGLRTQGLVHVWHDRLIQPGANWAREIDQNLDHADVVVLLVSADFMASQYCMGIELKRALERSRTETARVIPVLIRTCDLEGAPFSELQWLPTGSKPVKQWRDRDAAWTDVAKGVRKVVQDLVATRTRDA